MQILTGHTSFDAAYEVADYPYGFRLRCKKRYWIERCTKGAQKGKLRLASCTTNPKLFYEKWNKPKAGTYSMFLVMVIDDEGHVTTPGLTEYSSTAQFEQFMADYGEFLEDCDRAELAKMITLKKYADAKFASGEWKITISTKEYTVV